MVFRKHAFHRAIGRRFGGCVPAPAPGTVDLALPSRPASHDGGPVVLNTPIIIQTPEVLAMQSVPAAPERPHFTNQADEFDWAMKKLNNAIRSRRARAAFSAVIDAAKERFLDARALAAGASKSRWYTTTAMTIREALSQDADIQTRLRFAWYRCLEACGLPPHGTSLNYEQYLTMSRKVYLVVKLLDGDASVDPRDCMRTLHEDWISDSQGTGEMAVEAFFRSWFELADVHATRPAPPTPHISLLTNVPRRCTPTA